VPSLALGTGIVSPLDLTAAYTMFPGEGQVARPRGIISVFDAGGSQVLDRPVDREQLISPTVAFQMTSMLRDVIERGTGSPARMDAPSCTALPPNACASPSLDSCTNRSIAASSRVITKIRPGC